MDVTGNEKVKNVRELLSGTKGKIFFVEFYKRSNGQLRKMTARIGVKADVTGVGQSYDPNERNLLTVYDMNSRGFRMVNLEEVTRIKIAGKSYRF